jgi:hypothetical protein
MGEFIDDLPTEEGLVRQFDSFDRPVNPKGYTISLEHNGAVINKYNYNVMFMPEELDENGEIPNPYKVERLNFNPFEIMGDFDYDKHTMKPIILKSKKTGKLVDKNLRQVNQFGYFIDEGGNIVNHESKIRLRRDMLRSNGDFPYLLNYEGKAYDIKTVIGQFDRDPQSKQILLRTQPGTNCLVDRLARRVNQAGYLVDE